MCQHSEFEIVYYAHEVMVRKCRDCGQLEVALDYRWIPASAIVKLVEALALEEVT